MKNFRKGFRPSVSKGNLVALARRKGYYCTKIGGLYRIGRGNEPIQSFTSESAYSFLSGLLDVEKVETHGNPEPVQQGS